MTKRVFVLGATSAIAQATSRRFAEEHARLILAARDAPKLQAVAEDLRVRGAYSVQTLVGDLTDVSEQQVILSRALAEWDGLDVALIAYGLLPDQLVCEEDPLALRSAMETNCVSITLWLSLLGKVFEEQRTGVLAVIGSVAGDRGRRSNYIYGSAKAAIDTFVAGLRQRLALANVHVVLIKPGLVSTPMTAHLKQNLLYANPDRVAQGIHEAILSPRNVVYLPWYWKWIMFFIRLIPEPIFAKLNL